MHDKVNYKIIKYIEIPIKTRKLIRLFIDFER